METTPEKPVEEIPVETEDDGMPTISLEGVNTPDELQNRCIKYIDEIADLISPIVELLPEIKVREFEETVRQQVLRVVQILESNIDSSIKTEKDNMKINSLLSDLAVSIVQVIAAGASGGVAAGLTATTQSLMRTAFFRIAKRAVGLKTEQLEFNTGVGGFKGPVTAGIEITTKLFGNTAIARTLGRLGGLFVDLFSAIFTGKSELRRRYEEAMNIYRRVFRNVQNHVFTRFRPLIEQAKTAGYARTSNEFIDFIESKPGIKKAIFDYGRKLGLDSPIIADIVNLASELFGKPGWSKLWVDFLHPAMMQYKEKVPVPEGVNPDTFGERYITGAKMWVNYVSSRGGFIYAR
jgi:hypothetical protein